MSCILGQRSAAMARAGSHDAVHAVLGSPELLEHILSRLPVPEIRLGNWVEDLRGDRHPLEKGPEDRHARARSLLRTLCLYTPDGSPLKCRLAASWVNRAFRQAALRLPWRVTLERTIKVNDEAVMGLCKPRNLQALKFSAEGGSCPSAALLSYATSLRALEVSSMHEHALIDWLLNGHVPHQGGAGQAIPVLDWLAAQSSLKMLRVACFVWSDASWLHGVTQLKRLELEEYAGAPFWGQPNLESLYVQHNEVQGGSALDQWGSPSLTALAMSDCMLYLGSPPSGHPAHDPGVTSEGKSWLRGLRRLKLDNCLICRDSSGLRELVPCLTHLCLVDLNTLSKSSQSYGLHGVLASGLPLSLVELRLELYASDFPPHAVSALSALVKLRALDLHVWDGTLDVEEVQALVKGLSSLPGLAFVCFRGTLARSAKRDALVKDGVKGLQDLLVGRGGQLRLKKSSG